MQEGGTVEKGAVLVQLGDPALQPAIEAAEARLAEARAALATIDAGGKAAELTDIENNLARAKFDRDEAQHEYQSLRRLLEKHATTAVEVATANSKAEAVRPRDRGAGEAARCPDR